MYDIGAISVNATDLRWELIYTLHLKNITNQNDYLLKSPVCSCNECYYWYDEFLY